MKSKRILSVLLSLVLVFNIALAVEGKAEAKETSAMQPMSIGREGELKNVANSKARVIDTGINATTILNSNTAMPEFSKVQLDSGYYWILPITAKNTGYMYFDYYVDGGYASYADVTIEVTNQENALIFDESKGAESWASYVSTQGEYNVNEEDNNRGPIYVTKGQTFYAIIINWESDASVIAGIRAKLYTTGSRTLSQGTSKWTIASGMNKNQEESTTWFKVTPDRTGVMTVTLKEYGYSSSNGYVTLYNSDKKALSNKVTFDSAGDVSKVYFGVKEGVTYYLKVTGCLGTKSENYAFGVKYGMTKRTDRALGSKSKAKTLTRKADSTHTLFVASTSNSTDWYKFKVTSKRETVVKVNASGIKSGSLYITVYAGSTEIGKATLNANSAGEWTITNSTTYGKANPGTYYVKVVKGTKASGKYTIRYVK